MATWHFTRTGARALPCRLIRIGVAACASLSAASVSFATSVTVVGLFPTRAVVSINGGPPRTMSIGQTTAEGVKLVEAQSDNATFDVEGKRQTLRIGQYVGAPQTSGDDKVILKVEQGGHFYANAKVNGGSMRFLVDTGATMIAISTLDARRLGVSYLSAPTGRVQTANGVRMAWKVKLDTVSIGSITLNNIDATVLDGGLMTPLLGMSFLSRTSMQHEGDTLTMIKRF